MTRTKSSCSKKAKPIHRINHYQMDKYCVIPENIHTLHTEGNGNSEGKGGGAKGGIFRGGGRLLTEVLSGGV